MLRRTSRLAIAVALGLCLAHVDRVAPSAPVRAAAPAPLTIHAARLFDGRGRTIDDATIEVAAGRIVAVDHRAGPYTHDLASATLLPGLIDVHVHLDWHFGPDGSFGAGPGTQRETAAERDRAIEQNASRTLQAGFTTVQSVGSSLDGWLRAAIADGRIAGPRLLTSLGQIAARPGAAGARTGAADRATPEALRESVRLLDLGGADLVKIMLTGGAGDGGGPLSFDPSQLAALCGEARSLGLRSMVHAQGSDGIIAAVAAGCGQIEHGMHANDAAIAAMARAGVYFDPNIGLVLQNYLEQRDRFRFYLSPEMFDAIEAEVPMLPRLFRKALAAKLKMPLGSDAVAGAHGQNAREIVARVRAGQPAADALVAATSLAAESLGVGAVTGTLAPGYEADIIAVSGDPVRDINAVMRVVFVMKGGAVVTGRPH